MQPATIKTTGGAKTRFSIKCLNSPTSDNTRAPATIIPIPDIYTNNVKLNSFIIQQLILLTANTKLKPNSRYFITLISQFFILDKSTINYTERKVVSLCVSNTFSNADQKNNSAANSRDLLENAVFPLSLLICETEEL